MPERHFQRRLSVPAHDRHQRRLDTALAALPTLNTVRQRAVAVESREQAEARTLSQRGKGAMAYTKAYMHRGMIMASAHMTLALRRSLGMWTMYTSALCPYHGSRNNMAHPTDNITSTHHAITCANSGAQNGCHRDVALCLVDGLTMASVTRGDIKWEDTTCFDGERAAAARAAATGSGRTMSMDLVIKAGGVTAPDNANIRGKRLLLDVTITNPASASSITRGADRVAGTAAAHSESYKLDHQYVNTYNKRNSTLIPFAMEAYGRCGQHAMDLIDVLAEHHHRVSGQSMSIFKAKFYQHMSVGLQRALSRREFVYMEKLREKKLMPRAEVDFIGDMHADRGAFRPVDVLPVAPQRRQQ